MPELPDVEVFRRRLAASGLHHRVRRVEVRDESMLRSTTRSALGRALTGHTLTGTRRHGKHLFAQISDGGWLVLHFGMTGRLLHAAPDASEPGHARVQLHLDDGSRLVLDDQRRLGFMTLAADGDEYVGQEGLGQDALAIRSGELRALLRSRRGALKSALMDQTMVAGIGNIYSDEILFHARLDPRADAAGLDDAAYRRLHRQTVRVLRMAADRGADVARVPDSWLLPHRVDGEPCPRGNGTVRRFTMSGRGAFSCPTCQPGTRD